MIIPFKTKPRAQQLTALQRSDGMDAFAYFMTMRTGKTKVIFDDAARAFKAGRIQTLIVLAPNGVQRQWVTQADQHCGVSYSAGFYSGALGAKAKREFKSLISRDIGNRLKILTFNIEAASNATGRTLLQDTIDSCRRAMLVIDESTRIKNPTAVTTKFILRLAPRCAMRRVLNGTPITQSPLDLYTQFQFLDPRILGMPTFTQFRSRYAVVKRVLRGGAAAKLLQRGIEPDHVDRVPYAQLVRAGIRPGKDFFEQIDSYRNLTELEAKIAPYVYRLERKDVQDLPDIVLYRRDVTMTAEQKRIYKELEETACARLGIEPVDLLDFFLDENKVEASNALTKLLKAQQVLGGHVNNTAREHRYIEHNRIRVLHEIIDETPGKIIVWARFKPEIQEICKSLCSRFGDGAVAEFHGGVSQTSREMNKVRFQEDADTRFLVGQPAAGGVGQTFDAADTVVNYSNDYSLYNRLQSMERATAFGKHQIAVIDMVCPGTIDEKILDALLMKQQMADDFNFQPGGE